MTAVLATVSMPGTVSEASYSTSCLRAALRRAVGDLGDFPCYVYSRLDSSAILLAIF